MSYRYDFLADIEQGCIRIPDEIAARLRSKGIERVRVVMTSAAEDLERLAVRGIDETTVSRVAAAQSIDPDVATVVLTGEGAAHGADLATRLHALAGRGAE